MKKIKSTRSQANALVARIERLEKALETAQERLYALQDQCFHEYRDGDGECGEGPCLICGYDPLSKEAEDRYFEQVRVLTQSQP